MIKGYLKNIIETLGYDKAEQFYYYADIPFHKCSKHIETVLKELSPVAVYMVNYSPFICFFDVELNTNIQELSWKIWNAQLEIAICVSHTTVEIYYGKALKKKNRCLHKLANVELADNTPLPFSYLEIKSESFWKKYQKYLDKHTTLNNILLQNIRFITDKLKAEYHIPFVTKLVLRLIFIRYLIDRGINIGYEGFDGNIEVSRKNLVQLCGNKESLYAFFAYLKKTFNGNLFEVDHEIEDESLSREAMEWIGRFLSGKEVMENGQLAFWNLYDFKMIPVDLISNIYEILLGEEGREKDKAFYTPSYLADYIIQQETEQSTELGKILDPACGSGVFLVLYYRKLVEEEKRRTGYISDGQLVTLMKDNIYGVDRNPEAVCVAAFSLYLTILDYKDIKNISDFKLPNLIGDNLVCTDFFEDEKLAELRNNEFDFIIGNPPWGKPQNSERHINYCKQNNLPQQNCEISRSFLYKVKEYSSKSTKCCFILPSKIFYNLQNPAKKCREYLLKNVKIRSLLELSSVVTGLFENALAPAVVLSFQYQQEFDLSTAQMKHISLRPSRFFYLFHMLIIEKTDVKYVGQSLLLEYDWLWKTLVYGNTGDFENIRYLKKTYKTLKDKFAYELPKLIQTTGVQYNDGKTDASALLGRPLFKPRGNLDHFYINLSENSFQSFVKKRTHRIRNIEVFEAPYLLLTKGINPKNYRMRAVCCEDKNFVFPETVYGIKGTKEQTEFLYTLAGLFNSSFYAYYNLMVGASTGIDRRQRFIENILQFPYPKKNIEAITRCSRELHQLKKQVMIAEGAIEEKLKELDECVLEAFGLKENVYVQYALDVTIPMVTQAERMDAPSKAFTLDDYIPYANIVYRYFAEIYEHEGKYVQIEIYPEVYGDFAALILKLVEKKPKETIGIVYSSLRPDYMQFVCQSYNEVFYNIRDNYYFEENSFMIIKSRDKRNWHPANAHMDLAEIIQRILRE